MAFAPCYRARVRAAESEAKADLLALAGLVGMVRPEELEVLVELQEWVWAVRTKPEAMVAAHNGRRWSLIAAADAVLKTRPSAALFGSG